MKKLILAIMIFSGVVAIAFPEQHVPKPLTIMERVELINTLEDMHEWLAYDIEENRIDSTTGELYRDNIKDLLITLK